MNEFPNVIEMLRVNSDKFMMYDLPQPEVEILELEQRLNLSLPEDYRSFLLNFGTVEFHNIRLLLFDLDRLEDFNPDRDWSVDLPEMFFLGNDLGNYVLYFDPFNRLGRGNWAIYSASLGNRSFEYSKYQAQNFTHLIQRALKGEELTDGVWLKDAGSASSSSL